MIWQKSIGCACPILWRLMDTADGKQICEKVTCEKEFLTLSEDGKCKCPDAGYRMTYAEDMCVTCGPYQGPSENLK